jgi:AraC-like DNA-binding protein
LREFLDCLWVQRIGAGDGVYTQPVLPDACIDIVALDGAVLLAGPATRGTSVQLRPGDVTVGARFRTGTAPALVGVSAAELRDQDVRLDEIWDRVGREIEERILVTESPAHRMDGLVDLLLGRLEQARSVDPVGVGIGPKLTEQPARTLAAVAAEAGLSQRQLRRRVEDSVGYSPRMLRRILRFQRFLTAARTSRPGRQLAALAADAGYADQAHLTRESRELSGSTPAALLDREVERLTE